MTDITTEQIDHAVKYQDDRGRVRWQPQSSTGARLIEAEAQGWVWREWALPPTGRPVLYRSRRRAERIARRADKRVEKRVSSLFREVGS